MGLFSKGGKLLIDGARLRGCCCDKWKLTAYQRTEELSRWCRPTITGEPNVEDAKCIVADPVSQARTYGNSICANSTDGEHCNFIELYPFCDPWLESANIEGNVAEVVLRMDVGGMESPEPLAPWDWGVYRFHFTFTRCA